MYTPTTDWLEQVKHVAAQMMMETKFVLTGTVSSVNPTGKPPTVRVVLEPYEIETGWLPVHTVFAGNGYGLVLPPPEEGTSVLVVFEMGDISHGKVIAAQWNDKVPMPNVQPGTAGLFHKSGSSISIGPDGLVTIKGKNQTVTF